MLLFRLRAFPVLVSLLLVASCLGRAAKSEDDLTPFGVMLGLSLANGSMPAPATNASTAPTVDLPAGTDLPAGLIQVAESAVELPQRIDGTFVPIGKVYEVGPDLQGQEIPGNLYLPSGMAELTYEYDPDELDTSGFLEEFAAFYYDRQEEKWLPVDRIEVNTSTHVVKVFTSHFTPFVLTAVPAASGGIADPPACIADDFPSGISGSAGAEFTIVDTDFKYYKDRMYTIDRTGGSFDTLGFNGALGISVCNGNSPCGTFAQHKQFTGTNYIQFTAHTNIDLYLMYDTRGGVTLADDSRDAPWIQASGFVNTGHFIDTSDAVGKYRVYKKSYNKGDTVSLDGNRNGVTVPGIDTNYWIVIKRQGVTAAEPAAKTCEAKPSLTPPLSVSNVRIAPGSNQMSLAFQIPDSVDFAGAVIRRSTSAAPSRIGDGIEPTGTVVSPTAYRDESLSANTQYYYTIFALDQNGAYGPGVSVSAKTGPDGDGDGLSNAFESSFLYAPGVQTDPALPDTDADGIADGIEFINGTDPLTADTQKPVVTQFELTSAAVTTRPRTTFLLNGTDNQAITGWKITQTDTPPVSWGGGWTVSPPTSFDFVSAGNHKLYAWAVDAAGNVGAAVSELTINLEGINAPKYLYNLTGSAAGTDRAIDIYSINPATGQLQSLSSHTLPDRPVLPNGSTAEIGTLLMHPGGQFLYQLGQEGAVRVLRINTDGTLQNAATAVLSDFYAFQGTISSGGKVLLVPVVTFTGGEYLRSYFLDANGALSPEISSLFTNYTARNLTALPNGFVVGDIAVTNGGVTSFSLDETTGFIEQRYVLGDWTNYTVADPLGRYVYAAHVRSGNIQTRTINIDGTLSLSGQKYVGSNDGRPLAVDPTGQYVYVGRASTRSIDIYESGSSYTLIRNVTAGFTASKADSMLIDSSGTLAFVKTNSGATLLVYRIEAGDLTLLSTTSGQWGYSNSTSAVATRHDGNDPPLANAGFDRWVAVGESAALHGHNTFDPDAVRCNADATKYVASWTFVSKPAGSSLADSDIANGNTKSSARFVPDVSGDYKLRLTFTDDPGTCAGAPKAASATVTIHAGVLHTSPVDSLDTLPAVSGYEPVFIPNGTSQEDWGGDMMWAVTLKADQAQYLICVTMRNYANQVCNDPNSWLNPVAAGIACGLRNSMNCEAQFEIIYSILCMSPELHRPDAQQFCELVALGRPPVLINGTHVRVDLNRGHFWIHTRHRTHYRGHWQWWDYN